MGQSRRRLKTQDHVLRRPSSFFLLVPLKGKGTRGKINLIVGGSLEPPGWFRETRWSWGQFDYKIYVIVPMRKVNTVWTNPTGFS